MPWQNYLAWLILGYLFARLWQRLRLDLPNPPILGVHVYLAQLLYFGLVLLR